MDNNSPIFVVGTPRSGTTLTAKILGRHPRIFMPGETHFFDDIFSGHVEGDFPVNFDERKKLIDSLLTIYGRYNEPEDQSRIDFLVTNHGFREKLINNATSYTTLFNLFMKTQADFLGKLRWGNNAPRDIFNIQEIQNFYKDVKIIICVRDVRDFLLSYKGKWRATSAQEVERIKKLYHPVLTSLLWKSSMKLVPHIQTMIHAENLFILKYENLVTEPDVTIQNLCGFLQENYSSDMLHVTSANSSHGSDTSGIFSSSVGKWKNKLSNEEVATAQLLTRHEMQLFGYGLSDTSCNYLFLFRYFLTFPFAIWRGLVANKEKRGPLLPYLLKRFYGLLS